MNASIVIPAYNSEKTIAKTIQACKKQEFAGRFEIIIVDDGSTDSTKKILLESGVKVLSQKNSGPARARNLGAKNAEHEILVFTDADCEPEKNWLAEMVSQFTDKSVAGVQGAYRTRQKSLIARFVQAEIEGRYDRMKRFSSELDWVGSYSAAYRKKDFFAAKGFDESFPGASGEDPELSYKLHKAGKTLVFNPKAIVYHTHPDTVQKYFRTKYYRAFYRIALYSKHKDKIFRDSYTPQGLKAQVFLGFTADAFFIAGISLLLLGTAEAAAQAFIASLFSWFLVAATALPFMAFAWKKDKLVAVAAIPLILLRTSAFKGGLLAGAVKKVLAK